MTSPNLLHRSQSLRELFLYWSRSARLRNSQRPRQAREHGYGNTGQYQTGQHGDRQYIVLYALPGRRVRASEDNALYFVVYPATSLECVRGGLRGEIVQVCLEEPEGLWMRVSRPVYASTFLSKHTNSAPLTDSSHRSIMNSSRAIDSLSMLISRWHSLRVAVLVSCCGAARALDA